jgi:hypothetical protein
MLQKIVLVFQSLLFACLLHAQVAEIGAPLSAWQPGYLDLHHINTGRGNAAFYIFPDGTTMLCDAGEIPPTEPRIFTPRNSQIKPNYSKKPYEWIVHYIRQLVPNKIPAIDYALITHFHDDHFGNWYPGAPLSAKGNYVLTGITGVADSLPVGCLLDRGWPEYKYPYNMHQNAAAFSGEIDIDSSLQNYFRFIAAQQKRGMLVQGFKAGSASQIQLKASPAKYPTFTVRNIKSNGLIWTGKDSAVREHFTQYNALDKKTYPDENILSQAFTIRYGKFVYYTGGDNAGNVFTGDSPFRDVESAIAKVVGQVDVATMDHHGNMDAVNETMIAALQPRVWVGLSWSSDHPGHEVLRRITNQHIYNKQRDLFATNMLEANKIVIGPLVDNAYKSQQGHIVIRVLPGGDQYYVIILDDTNPSMKVKAVFGPYISENK